MAAPVEAVLHELQEVERRLATLQGLLIPSDGLALLPGIDEALRLLRPAMPGEPWTEEITIDLSQARDRERIPFRLPLPTTLTVRNLSELDGVTVWAWLDDPTGPGFSLLDYRVLQFRQAFQEFYVSHDPYPGRQLRLQLTSFRLVRAEPKDLGRILVETSAQATVATEVTLAELRNALVPNALRRFALDLTQAHADFSLAAALGLTPPIPGVGLTINRLGGAAWSMRLLPASRHPDTWLSSDFNEGARLEGPFEDVLFTNAASAGASPAIFAVSLRVAG